MSRNYTSAGPSFIPYNIYVMWMNENDIVDQEERDELIHYFVTLDSKYIETIDKRKA